MPKALCGSCSSPTIQAGPGGPSASEGPADVQLRGNCFDSPSNVGSWARASTQAAISGKTQFSAKARLQVNQ